jgi:cytochrome P450
MYSASADSVSIVDSKCKPLCLSVQVITTILHFLLAMMAHPEVLAKAQEEIDRVVGSDRLPTFDDRPFLPYGSCPKLLQHRSHLTYTAVDAILSETYRWGSPVPLSETLLRTIT